VAHEEAPAADEKNPTAQAAHAVAAVAEAPPLPKLPGGQGTCTPVPGQYLPAPQAVHALAPAPL
jgi:hypothetical protein